MVSDPIVDKSYPDIGVTIIGESLENNGEKSYQKLGKSYYHLVFICHGSLRRAGNEIRVQSAGLVHPV